MIDPITAAAAATKAYAGVRAFIEAGKSIEDTFQVVARWQGHASDIMYASKRQKKRTNPLKQVVFAESIEAEAAQVFAAKKRIENQRKEIVTLLQYAYGNEGLEEYRNCMKEVQEQRQREVYAQQEAKDTIIKSFWIVVLVGIAGSIIAFIFDAVSSRG
jgi:CHASE3 domain sensor protein|tara:strand:+ start:158 stop:634 length:477 start_codon:yes stop_codon:yes gene_type:complete